MRRCDSCGTPLGGRRGHGFVRGARVVCGRSQRLVGYDLKKPGNPRILRKTPECSA